MANPAISPDRIGDAGRQLFGEHWQGPLSKALGVSSRQLRYWLSGDDAPDQDHLRRLVALLDHASAEGQRLGGYFRQVIPHATNRQDGYHFPRSDLRRLDRSVVEHIPTRSRISFYDYVDPPPDDFVPGGTISNSAFWSTDELAAFQRAAWKVMAEVRYGAQIRDVRRLLRDLPGQVLVADLVRILRGGDESSLWTTERVKNAIDELVVDEEAEWLGLARQAVRYRPENRRTSQGGR